MSPFLLCNLIYAMIQPLLPPQSSLSKATRLRRTSVCHLDHQCHIKTLTNSNCIAIEEIWPYCNLVLNWDTTSAAVNVRNNPAGIVWVKNYISAGRMRTPCPCGTLVCASAFSQCFSLSFCWDHLSLYPYMLHLHHLTFPLLGRKQQCQHDFALEALFCTGPKSFLWIFAKKKEETKI